MIAIVKYGFGNTGSIKNMFSKIGHEAFITDSLEEIAMADKIVLPGVGSFDHGMEALRRLDLEAGLTRLVKDGNKPILGICLGMQLMTLSSEEGVSRGLGWINADTCRFIPGEGKERIPHMGWNTVSAAKTSPLTEGFDAQFRYYFVHSYYVKCHNPQDSLLETEYIHPFTSAFQNGNIYGVQFHPEKSHRFGMRLLRNFAERG